MSTSVDTHVGEVAIGLDLANLLAVNAAVETLQFGSSILGLAGPLEGLGPSLVAEPVTDEVSISGIDQDRNLLEKARNQAVIGLHPVTVEEEVTVDVKVAGVVALNFGTQSLPNFGLVEVLRDVVHLLVAKAATLALGTDIVDVLTRTLIRSQEGVVAVDGGRDTDPSTLTVVAGLNHRKAARKGIVHRLAGGFIQNSRVATLTASHWSIVWVLGETISQTVSDKHRLEVNVALLVGEDLGSEDWNVVASIGLSSNVEVLLRVFRELLEEEREQSIDIFASSNGITDRRTAVGVANIDRLVKEDHGGIGVP